MLVNTNSLEGIYKEANSLLTGQRALKVNEASKVEKDSKKLENFDDFTERNTYGMISLELMNDEQYMAFERVTSGMSINEKIEVAQTLTRAGNLSASVEKVMDKENLEAKEDKKGGFLGLSEQKWEEVGLEFQENLNHLEGLYTKNYNKGLSSNYNDIFKKNQEAKTQRILREFSHAIYAGNTKIDVMS